MGEHQQVPRLGLMAAGFMVGCLVNTGIRNRKARVAVTRRRADLVRPGGIKDPGSASWSYSQDQPWKKRRYSFTNNAVIAGVVSAIVAGVISFLVAHYETQDAARQAVFSQQAQVASQTETAASSFYETIQSAYNFWYTCNFGDNWPPSCPRPAALNDLNEEKDKLAADEFSIADEKAVELAIRFEGTGLQIINAPSRKVAERNESNFTTQYLNLITRCGEILQGQ